MRLPELTENDSRGLGWMIGGRYRNWAGAVDIVLGFDAEGWVYVRDERTGIVRPHLTSATIGGELVSA